MVNLTVANVSKRLTEEVIDRCFKIKTNSKDSPKSIVVTKAAPAGEGLISAVYRIHVTGSHHQTSFVAKGLVSDRLLRRSLRCSIFFEREAMFFSQILPQFKEVQKSSGAKESIQNNIPICYAYHIGDEDDYILLEDLSETACESVATPTKTERDLTLQALAHMHAVSIALRTKRPRVFFELASKIPEIYYTDSNQAWYAKYLQNAIDIDKNVIREFEDESSIYFKKFMNLVENDFYRQVRELLATPKDHPVMNHGDAWLPNFMCSKKRAVAIDFQLFRCASLATDLSFYLCLCGNLCLNEKYFFEAVKIYYNFLVHYLEDMGLNASEIFSWEDLWMELKMYGRFGVLAALTTIPLLASQRCDVGLPFEDKYGDVERIPLEDLWRLTPIRDLDKKKGLVNAVRVAVDVGLI
ncbi:uncharacterized protein LOC114362524 [Ostrinia furnacalis]|uniref:uncharacterized protein LOC114362524 n=1 Tax=Ostrinia furnacalis TaxID=93504 RepID=UPI00103A0B7A|nr:uncharacterized protein LOC114362524 [Ostrinia furnacalis]